MCLIAPERHGSQSLRPGLTDLTLVRMERPARCPDCRMDARTRPCLHFVRRVRGAEVAQVCPAGQRLVAQGYLGQPDLTDIWWIFMLARG